MVKTFIITIGLIVIIALLVVIAVRQQTTIITQPVQEIIPVPEEKTPRVEEPERGLPSQRAPEPTPKQPGIKIEKVYPQEVDFWVNEIKVPEVTDYYGAGFIPIKKSQLKTFAGSFGPYFEDPTASIRVFLCAEFYKVQAAPSCEIVPTIYRGRYASFAKGYQYDEYIGGMAAKDYIAYYNVYAGDTLIGASNKAVIRTVND